MATRTVAGPVFSQGLSSLLEGSIEKFKSIVSA